MKGLDKFKAEIKAEVDKVKDTKKKKFIEAQAKAIIDHITSVCDKEYDDLLSQTHKSFRRMWSFVTEHAKEMAVDGCAMVPDSMVFGWIDEYVGLDDKKAVEDEKKKAKENEAKMDEIKNKVMSKVKTTTKTTTTTTMEQVSIFDLM